MKHFFCDVCGNHILRGTWIRMKMSLILPHAMGGTFRETRSLDLCSWRCVDRLSENQQLEVPFTPAGRKEDHGQSS